VTIRSRIKGAAIGAFVGGAGDRLRRAAAEASRLIRREARAVEFWHDPTDPWSFLLAQAVERLAKKYPVEWRFHVVSPPASDVDARPGERLAHAVRDAQDLAAHWDLDFTGTRPMDAGSTRWVCATLIRERPFAEQVRAAIELGHAAWSRDDAALLKVVGKWGNEGQLAVPPVLASGYEKLRDAGHYWGGMLSYGGEWYWGIDRLALLEERLAEDTGVAAGTGVLAARPESTRPPERLAATDGPLPVDVWFSFRSPYSYLALDRIAELPKRFPIELRLRPVMPMEDRGIPAPTVKKLYIVRDVKRLADRMGVPFGTLADPRGQGVAHCLAIAKHAIERGRGLEFLLSAARGIWSEARDVGDYVDLRTVVERAGLGWGEARAAIGDDSWKAWAAANADDLTAIGLWGVPSFRAGTYQTWGQDRVDFLADRLRRHFAAPATGSVAAP
jgi:2-hydroxychromene-2-carboxylate isomerase